MSIASVFKEIGKADELGSGTRNLFKYCMAFCGHDPEFYEEDIFRFTLPLSPQATPQATAQATAQVTAQATPQATAQADRIKRILEFCKTPRTRDEIQDFLNYRHREHFRKEILNPLLKQGLLHPTIPDKLTSPNQSYYSGESRIVKSDGAISEHTAKE